MQRPQWGPGPTILFVAGSSRSGSTLLDAMCGQIEGFVSVGELRHIWVRGFLRNEPCGCGRPFLECPFWKEAISLAFGSMDPGRAVHLRSLQKRADRMWRIPQLRRGTGGRGFRAAVGEYGRARWSARRHATAVG